MLLDRVVVWRVEWRVAPVGRVLFAAERFRLLTMRSRRYAIIAMYLCADVVPAVIRAQGGGSGAQVDSGRLIRITAAPGQHFVGRLLAPTFSGADIRMCRYPGPPCEASDASRIVVLHPADVQRIEIKRGDRGFLGAGIGIAIGVFVLAPLSSSDWGCESPGCNDHFTRNAVLYGAGLGRLGYALGHTSIKWGAPQEELHNGAGGEAATREPRVLGSGLAILNDDLGHPPCNDAL